MLDALREWLTNRVRRRKEDAEGKRDRLENLPDYVFPEHAARSEKEAILRTTPYRVKIYGPRAQLLAIIEQDETMPEPVVTRTSPQP